MDENDARYEIRLPNSLKTAFLSSTKANDRDGSQMVRDFIRDYVKAHSQGDLLASIKPRRSK